MVEGVGELIGFCLGVLGLIGASAVTGLPMWRVTAFIQENIIVMETRWEGLWMNCYRQANIRMQCKVYDSLLYLPPELQASRGLMCCSVALGFLGLVASLPGLSCISCFPDQPRVKSLVIAIAGSMEIMAAICVLIPVSWTAHSIIRDFYNPLLLDAQRRELGEALYIGWVTAFILFCSGVVFLACRSYQENRPYHPVYAPNRLTMSHFQPLTPTPSSISSISHQPLLQTHSFSSQQPSPLAYNVPAAPPGGQAPLYNVPVVYPANMVPVQHHPSLHSTPDSGIISIPINPLHSGTHSAQPSLQSIPPAAGYDGNFGTAVQPTVPRPPMVGYKWRETGSHHLSSTHSSSGMYI
ncbi:claudin-8-like [Pangasianodon hypophthalmus]|uniref:claudin-8-like n=1 Tax=Pangasianodon hypophthalmus TaxID=310915 RepID=UPI0023079F5E|nr:claudin-8-like [Pangasianodon hypophthalmus]